MPSFKGFDAMESETLYILGLTLVAIVWWVAIWGITDELVERAERVYGISKLKIYSIIALAIMAFLVFHPKLLHHL